MFKSFFVLLIFFISLSAFSGERKSVVFDPELPLGAVESVYAVNGTDVNLGNYQFYVEPPLQPAVKLALEKNIATYSASANKNHFAGIPFESGIIYSNLAFSWEYLSQQNRKIILGQFPSERADKRLGHWWEYGSYILIGSVVLDIRENSSTGYKLVIFRDSSGETVAYIYIPMKMEMKVGQLSDVWLNLVGSLEQQEPVTRQKIEENTCRKALSRQRYRRALGISEN